MTRPEVTHVAFADESHWNKGRYRALGLVTLRDSDLSVLNAELKSLLAESDVKELKWSNVREAKHRFAALKFCEFAIKRANAGQVRVDVLTWDIEDSRHKVMRRDDIANLQRMYYHLMKYVLRERWPDGSIWTLHPDENTAMDWASVQYHLIGPSASVVPIRDISTENKLPLWLKVEFKIEHIQPLRSHDAPFIQLADLFAGLSVFSREDYERFRQWKTERDPQRRLVGGESGPTKITGSDRERFTVLDKLDELCKKGRLGVSLKTHGGLRTLQPANRINFWWYEPQSPEDKAPTKTRR
jgi:hypothetical protein